MKAFPTLQHMMPQIDLREVMEYLASTEIGRAHV